MLPRASSGLAKLGSANDVRYWCTSRHDARCELISSSIISLISGLRVYGGPYRFSIIDSSIERVSAFGSSRASVGIFSASVTPAAPA